MTEKVLYDNMKRHMNLNTIKLQRVENKVSTAMPDVHFHIATGGSGWIENKWTNNPGNKIKFQDGQERWCYNHCQSGGFALILVGHNNGQMSLYWGDQFYGPDYDDVQPDPVRILDRNKEGFAELVRIIKSFFPEQRFFKRPSFH